MNFQQVPKRLKSGEKFVDIVLEFTKEMEKQRKLQTTEPMKTMTDAALCRMALNSQARVNKLKEEMRRRELL